MYFVQYINVWHHHLVISIKCPYQHPVGSYKYIAMICKGVTIKYVAGRSL